MSTVEKKPYIHLSIDDTFEIFKDLAQNAMYYSSIFENPYLHFLEMLHTQYGLVASMYCFTEEGDFIWRLNWRSRSVRPIPHMTCRTTMENSSVNATCSQAKVRDWQRQDASSVKSERWNTSKPSSLTISTTTITAESS